MSKEMEDLRDHPTEADSSDRLDSWKEIAAYLRCSERTVQRWEEEGLPVHRHPHKKKAAIYSYKAEIDAWWRDGHERLKQIEQAHEELKTATPWRNRRRLAEGVGLLLILAVFLGLNLPGILRKMLGSPPPTRIQSLAVLPLENLSHDTEQEYFADGMTDALITDLARIGHLKVISRTSSMQYKQTKKSLPEIARELNVDGIVEGTVQRSGDRVRITAQLIEAPKDRHLWAKTYEADLQNILTVENDVARSIANEIEVQLTPAQRSRMASAPPVSREAYELYLRGRYYWNQRTCTAVNKALQYFESARKQDPNWALSYVGIADSNISIALYCPTPPGPPMLAARSAVLRALQIDNNIAEAHASLALLYRYDWNWEATARELKRAIELNPNYASAHHWYALYWSSQLHHEHALTEIDRALELDPLAPILSGAKAFILFMARRYPETIQLCQKDIDFDPNWPWFHFWLGAASIESGAFDMGLSETDLAYKLSPQWRRSLGTMGYAYGRSGRRAEALKVLAKLQDLSKETYVSSFDMSLIYIGLGEKQEALTSLERAYEEHSTDYLNWLNSLAWFDALHSDSRFQDLLRRMNLPDTPNNSTANQN